MSQAPLAAVTGGTGFLGVHLVTALAQAGFRLRLLARRAPAHPAFTGLTFATLRGSLEDEAALAELVRGADVVIHAAGVIKAHHHAAFLRANRDGTAAMARMATQIAPEAKFILISSLAAREPELSGYAFSKQAAEAEARQGLQAARLAIIRPPAIYGPWDKETLALFKASLRPVAPLLGNGKAAVIHAQDAAGAIAALAGEKFRPGLFSLADEHPEGYTLRALLEEAARATGGKPRFLRLPAGLVMAAGLASELWGRTRATPPIFTRGKAREILHPDWSVRPDELLPREIYTPRFGLAEGFAHTAAWYRAAGWLR
ncbi:NAD(P)-dependent oxidoreductase [Acidocella sp. KAb 2-4]|uniref:NAD-dependent epimerase/dehydratase family protein n=1 Tax=Acidocella sp. KAb 2-4 TaxID=2885158 RepID=UPI001D080A41|nr:NAD-dependent epimerase/dehydratase family protein [Acidocella sp. KAb 2-4]MCB5943894.1 NAD-dependent epimerase/dehydratase family protein [Acidocella sp. KAb 2-4]